MSGTELTQEETNERIDQVAEFIKALNNGDEETAADLRTKIKWPAWGLVAGKKVLGADYIRERGYNTELADRKFGPGWLDRDESEIIESTMAGPADKIFHDVERSILADMMAMVEYLKTRSIEMHQQARQARADLLPLMQEAAELRSIVLLLRIERAFLSLELEHIAFVKENIESLRAGIWEVDAAIALVGYVKDPDEYRRIAFAHTCSQDLLYGSDLPKDGAHDFFIWHRTRLSMMNSIYIDPSLATLYEARINNIDLAKEIYMELQRQALAAPGAREQMPRPAPPEDRESMLFYLMDTGQLSRSEILESEAADVILDYVEDRLTA